MRITGCQDDWNVHCNAEELALILDGLQKKGLDMSGFYMLIDEKIRAQKQEAIGHQSYSAAQDQDSGGGASGSGVLEK